MPQGLTNLDFERDGLVITGSLRQPLSKATEAPGGDLKIETEGYTFQGRQ